MSHVFREHNGKKKIRTVLKKLWSYISLSSIVEQVKGECEKFRNVLRFEALNMKNLKLGPKRT